MVSTVCKRPCFHDAYLQSYNEPGTTLVDTDGKGVERVTKKGLVVAGEEYELDCIIYVSLANSKSRRDRSLKEPVAVRFPAKVCKICS